MQRYEAKVISLLIIFASILCAMLLPIRVAGMIARRGERGRQILAGLSCFSGGIFLATYLLDMAPEVRALLEDTLLRPQQINYPLPELIIGAGFFFILIVELVVTTISQRRHHAAKIQRPLKNNKVDATVELSVTAKEEDKTQITLVRTGVDPTAAESTKVDTTVVESTGIDTDIAEKSNNVAIHDGIEQVDSPYAGASGVVVFDGKEGETRGMGYNNQAFVPPTNCADKSSNRITYQTTETDAADDESDVGHHHATRSVILVLALSLDSVFEGMAVGLRTTMQGVWNLTIAIVAHEVVIAFGMGMQLLKHQTRRTVVFVAVVYSLMSPFGGAIGTLLMETQGRSTNMDLTNGVLQGITAGIFIYVTFFEILNSEYSKGVSLMRLTTTLLGFVVMAALKAIPDGHHGSGLSNHSDALTIG